jgi:GMP synthase (glutamine-hydrolysing)
MKPFVLLQTRPEDVAADNEYEAFMEHSGLGPDELLRHRIHGGDFPILDFDRISGIMIGGGPYCVTTPKPKKSAEQLKCEAGLKKILDGVFERDTPLLAACYIGSVIEHQGGKISRKFPEVVGAYQMTKSIQAKKDKLLKDLPNSFMAYSGHKEACEVLPKTGVLLVSSATCPNQLVRFQNNIYACQFHPELDAKGLEIRIQIYKNYGYFPPEDAQRLVDEAQAANATEPVKILRRFVQIYKN